MLGLLNIIFLLLSALAADAYMMGEDDRQIVAIKGLTPAFHFDKPDRLLIDRSCQVQESPQAGIIVHDCDTKAGSSGVPLFCEHDDRLILLGLNISGLTRREYYDPGVYAAGEGFSSAVA